MIKKLFYVTLFFTFAATPLLGVSFRLKSKPSGALLSTKSSIISSLALGTGLSIMYKAAYPRDEKYRSRAGRITYQQTEASPLYLLGSYMSLYVAAGAFFLLATSCSESYALYLWNNRTDQEIYDDAQATYRYTIQQTALPHYLVQQLVAAPTAQDKEHIKDLYTYANYNPLAIITTVLVPFKHHYKALLQRLNTTSNLLHRDAWLELKNNMKQELERIAFSTAILMDIQKSKQKNDLHM
ncbi:hypothetical protein H0X48_06245 [Candidatus Dependentiae bacterium]|nr:hypothetical protein [Candidatus Dependentiae bacterium]